MSPTSNLTDQELPSQAETACGGRITITPDSPRVHYKDEIVYFCGWDCKQQYEEDPLSSCMAARLLSGE